MLAPTGKVAYNIKGNTIHSALAIPASQSLRNYKSLDSSRLNTIRCQLGGIKLIFIDEISMVGNTMFTVWCSQYSCYWRFIRVTTSDGWSYIQEHEQ